MMMNAAVDMKIISTIMTMTIVIAVDAAADMITETDITIMMQMRCLRAGALRLRSQLKKMN